MDGSMIGIALVLGLSFTMANIVSTLSKLTMSVVDGIGKLFVEIKEYQKKGQQVNCARCVTKKLKL